MQRFEHLIMQFPLGYSFQKEVVSAIKSYCFEEPHSSSQSEKSCQRNPSVGQSKICIRSTIELRTSVRWYDFESLFKLDQRALTSGFKGSYDQSHFIFETNVGKKRIRHRTTQKLNLQTDSKSIEDEDIEIQSRSMSDPPLSDIDFKYKMAWV